ncbi:hypothetical protein V1511DRAFT_501231 [Dipodascopsis uninucleata]
MMVQEIKNPEIRKSMEELNKQDRDVASGTTGYSGIESDKCWIMKIPIEIRMQVLGILDGESLLSTSMTCRSFNKLICGTDDLWMGPCLPLIGPSRKPDEPLSHEPYGSYQELFRALRPHIWFTPGVWHGDKDLLGSFYVSRYNFENGEIEAHEIFCIREASSMQPPRVWSQDPNVIVQDFRPSLERSQMPVIRLGPKVTYDKNGEIPQPPSPRGMISTFFHAAAINPERIYPSMNVWPPSIIPAKDRTRNTSLSGFKGHSSHRRDASKNLFRLRKWLTYTYRGLLGVSMGEVVETIARLDEKLWRPNKAHPFRGIWIGDYESHGTEFILFHQSNPTRLEAIKLTGDPNVPRGEYTFTVDDLSHTERICTDPEFSGARVVSSQGHTAALNFTNSTFSTTELFIISDDEVAHYWIDLYRIKTYRRVNIDALIQSSNGLKF